METIVKNDIENITLHIKKPEKLLRMLTSLNIQNIIYNPSPFLSETLMFLDIDHCVNLKNLPVEFSNCSNLRILFIKECRNMTIIPPVLGNMPNLTRLGLKSNGIRIVHGKSLPPNIEHLILTDNNITHIDHDVFVRLGKSCRKLMLSHNKLRTFGNDTDCSMLQNIELLRLSNNNLTSLPKSLYLLPKLSWITISGNPNLKGTNIPKISNIPILSQQDIVLNEDKILGRGASGKVVLGKWDDKNVAVKIFHGVTSDGKADDELRLQSYIGGHGSKHLVTAIALMVDKEESPNSKKLGVVMKVLSKELSDLALPPTIEEVIEDRYEEKKNFDFDFVIAILRGIADALYYLHVVCRVSHGDVYAHNIVVNKQNKNLNSVYLLDLGAASYYGGDKDSLLDGELCEKVEVRAFGILANELLNNMDNINIVDQKKIIILKDLVYICSGNIVKRRPLFVTILKILNGI